MNIQVQKLRKSYKDREVLKNISFEIKEVMKRVMSSIS